MDVNTHVFFILRMANQNTVKSGKGDWQKKAANSITEQKDQEVCWYNYIVNYCERELTYYIAMKVCDCCLADVVNLLICW